MSYKLSLRTQPEQALELISIQAYSKYSPEWRRNQPCGTNDTTFTLGPFSVSGSLKSLRCLVQ
jgi:hypothetical protein